MNSPIFSCVPSPRSCLSHIEDYTTEIHLCLEGFQKTPTLPSSSHILQWEVQWRCCERNWIYFSLYLTLHFPPHTQAPLLPLAHLLLFVSHFTAPGSSQCLPLSPGGFKDLPLTLPEELQFGQFAPVSSSHRWEETGHLSVHFAVTENKEFLTFPSQNAAGSHLSSNFLGSFAQLGQ